MFDMVNYLYCGMYVGMLFELVLVLVVYGIVG